MTKESHNTMSITFYTIRDVWADHDLNLHCGQQGWHEHSKTLGIFGDVLMTCEFVEYSSLR